MSSIGHIGKDIQFNENLSALLGTMKAIAASQFQSLERSLERFEPFFEVVQEFLGPLDLDQIRHPFVKPEGPDGVIAITSDTGLLGGLNLQVVNTAVKLLNNQDGTLVVIGQRGQTYARECGYQPVCVPGINVETRYGQAMDLRDYCFQQVVEGRVGAISVVYPRAVSFTQQRVETLSLLPCQTWGPPHSGQRPTPVLESNPEDLVEYLVWLWMGQRFYELFGASRLAELAARSVHLEGSAQELERRGTKLRLEYCRGRRELIDRNMRELFTARLSHVDTDR